MKNIILIFILIVSFACSTKESQYKNDTKEFDRTDSLGLGIFDSRDTLYILAKFDECGEWGGHQECIKIFDKKKKLHLSYKKNNADCSKIEELHNAKLSLVKEMQLNDMHKKEIEDYMVKLMKNKLVEDFVDHSGKEFEMSNTDSTLFISVYDNNPENPLNYNILLNSLGIK